MGFRMKTTTFTPAYFLVHKELVIKIITKTVIGRSQGDVILEDNHLLSSKHCLMRPTPTQMFIRDLSSTNGVFVNKSKIHPEHDIELHVGDVIKLGNDEYILLNDEKEVKKMVPPPDRRKGARPENLYTFKNLKNFYSANKLYRTLYFAMILAAIVSSILHLNMDVQVPVHLNFLNKLYSEQILYSGIRLVFMVWMISILHSLGMVLYLNRHPVRQGIGMGLYFVVLLNVANFNNGPMGEFKSYLVERDGLENLKIDTSAITHLKNITSKQSTLTTAFNMTLLKLPNEQKIILRNDFNDIMIKADKEIKKISLN
jgi:hypothetical protein